MASSSTSQIGGAGHFSAAGPRLPAISSIAAAATAAAPPHNGTHHLNDIHPPYQYHNKGVAANGGGDGGSGSGTSISSVASLPETYIGYNRKEMSRLLVQTLSGMGYTAAAESVMRESGCQLESAGVTNLRAAIMNGSWVLAENLLFDPGLSRQGRGVTLTEGADPNLMRFWIREQNFLEMLERRDTTRALNALRTDLTPLFPENDRLHFLSGLLMCPTVDDLMTQANWDGVMGNSRQNLLGRLSGYISPEVMLPDNRLVNLLDQARNSQLRNCLYHTEPTPPSLYVDHMCDGRSFPAVVAWELSDMAGADVWKVQFSNDGTKLAACGAGPQVHVWDVETFDKLHVLGDHQKGVGNLAWSPDGSMLVTCSWDYWARLWDVKTGSLLQIFNKVDQPISGCVWGADSRSLILSSLDKRNSLRLFHVDGRLLHQWPRQHRLLDMCGSPDGRWLVAVEPLKRIYAYNLITRDLEFEMDFEQQPTSVSFSQDSHHLLVNQNNGELHLIDMSQRKLVRRYVGHSGGKYLIRSSFGGANENYVVSGSEDGDVFVWSKYYGALVARLSGHKPRSNDAAWNPAKPGMLASCGDDGLIKIWMGRAEAESLRKAKQAGERESGFNPHQVFWHNDSR